jgi:flagellar basal body L-ring protein FlgH
MYPRLWLLALLALLAACGNATIPQAAAPPQPTAAPPQPTAAPAQPTAAPAATQPAAPTAMPSSVAAAAIPEGLTPEGYHLLGRADAPVTLTMYSDFL